ncbi:hypothetical protein P7K49_021068 [Saguinus oedipus]|uniref:Uncharacterized protein n=1 Tax=Saguinus oedipus TaxID=9490 RepID=A0ABQ9USH0_SAGOE|nr:hypothetical protein P7K49_021068 [Saguinus oedipus]
MRSRKFPGKRAVRGSPAWSAVYAAGLRRGRSPLRAEAAAARNRLSRGQTPTPSVDQHSTLPSSGRAQAVSSPRPLHTHSNASFTPPPRPLFRSASRAPSALRGASPRPPAPARCTAVVACADACPLRKPIGQRMGPVPPRACAAIAAMASLQWGGDAGAAESERLSSHVTATELGDIAAGVERPLAEGRSK